MPVCCERALLRFEHHLAAQRLVAAAFSEHQARFDPATEKHDSTNFDFLKGIFGNGGLEKRAAGAGFPACGPQPQDRARIFVEVSSSAKGGGKRTFLHPNLRTGRIGRDNTVGAVTTLHVVGLMRLA